MKIKTFSKIFICLIMVVVFSTGCFGRTELHESFNEEEMITLAETVINEVHVNGVEAVINERMREDYREKYPLDDMKDDFESLRVGLGTFIDYTEVTVIGKDSPDERKEPFAIVGVTATYEKGELIFMLTFDTDKNLVGFYMKK